MFCIDKATSPTSSVVNFDPEESKEEILGGTVLATTAFETTNRVFSGAVAKVKEME